MSSPIVTDADTHALFRRFPDAARSFPRASLATAPTPVETLEEDGPEDILVKRDDLIAEPYGGNKVRKLEFLLGDAITRDFNSVWTLGAIGSHHCLATAVHGTRCGLAVKVLHVPQPVSKHVRRNIRALLAAGGQPRLASRTALPIELARERVSQWFKSASERDYRVPSGGSSPLGALGFVDAACELAEQIDRGEIPVPQAIYVAAGTCGTMCGLQVGLGLVGLSTVKIVGVRVIDRVLCNSARIKRLSAQIAGLLEKRGIQCDPSLWPEVELRHDFFGQEYGRPTAEGRAAMNTFSEMGGPPLEYTYTGKAFAALMHDRRHQGVTGPVLFWDTFSSRDLSDLLDKVSPADVPAEYRPFFEGPPELD